MVVRVNDGEGDVTGEAETAGVSVGDDDGVFRTGTGRSTVGEGPSIVSLTVRLWD